MYCGQEKVPIHSLLMRCLSVVKGGEEMTGTAEKVYQELQEM